MTLNIGKTYRFRYLDDVYTKADIRYFKICLADEPEQGEFMVRPLTSQLKYSPDYNLYCKVISMADNGYVRLVQDEMAFYKEIYIPHKIYSFEVVEELEPTSTGVRRVILECKETKLTHTYTCFDGMNCPVGDVVEYTVKLVERDCHVAIHFGIKEEELSSFLPENVFRYIGHDNVKKRFFDELEEWACTHKSISFKFNEMKDKLALNNRLWLFDYVRVLSLITMLSDVASLDDIETCCVLIKDIESWILNDSGLLTKFNEQNREDTKKKIETLISKSDNTLEAISIIRNDKQLEFVQNIVDKSAEGLQCDEKTLSILIRIIGLNKEIIQNNIAIFSQLIENYTIGFGDEDVAERLVYALSSYINQERKLLNKEIHFGRKKVIDNDVLADIIIGIGTLYNFCSSKELETDNELSLDQDKLFLVLCKYVSYLCSKEKATQLLNRALIFLAGKGVNGHIDGDILRHVAENPDKLADNIISFENKEERVVSERFHDNLHINYINGSFVVYRGNRLQGKDNIDSSTCVYTLPGISLQLHDLSAIKEWDKLDNLLSYRDKWKDYLAADIFHMQEDQTPEYVRIKVKPINTSKSNLIFCARTDIDTKFEGVIHFSGYCPNFMCSDLTKIFRSNMEFKAKIERKEDGKINFNITDNIRDFSNRLAEKQDSACVGLCLSTFGKRAFFITTNGIMCTCYLQREYEVREGDMFSLTVDAAVNPKYLPVACLIRELPKTHNRESLLTNQLHLLSNYNKSVFNGNLHDSDDHSEQVPHIHLILDSLFHIYDDKITRYNLYHIARLVCSIENKSLSHYYASCIQYMEMMECFENNLPIEYSFDEVHLHSRLLDKFPSIQNHKCMRDLLCNFGAGNDIDTLYSLSVNKELPDRVNRFARISLAYALIESVTDDEDITDKVKRLAIAEIGNDSDDEVISSEEEIDDEDDDVLVIEEASDKTENAQDNIIEEVNLSSDNERQTLNTPSLESNEELNNKTSESEDQNVMQLCFFDNGSYILSHDGSVEGITHKVAYTDNSMQKYVLQCYANGNINKMPVKNLCNLREEYEYRNGVYRETSLDKCYILDPNDYILALYKFENKEYCRLTKVASLAVHSSLGLRGISVVSCTDIKSLSWYSLDSTSIEVIAPILREACTGMGLQLDNSDYSNEIHWIKQYILYGNAKQIESSSIIESSNENEIINLLQHNEQKKVAEIFDKFTKVGRDIPKAQELAKESLTASPDSDCFWNLIQLLLKCNVNIYRKPIADAINVNNKLQSFRPQNNLLDNIVNTVFLYDDKYNHSLSLVYHYRDCLSDKAKNIIYKQCSSLPKPSDYKIFSEIVNLDFEENVEVLLGDAVPASYYHLYELIEQYKTENGRKEAKSMAKKVIDEISDKSISAQVFIQLINYAILDITVSYESLIPIKKILAEGFDAYLKLCSKKKSNIKIQKTVSHIRSYIGNKGTYSVIGEYRNHYILTSKDGLSTLLPKNCANGKYQKGRAISVTIVHADASHRTLIVSEKPSASITDTLSLPLLELGEEIEVKFSNIGKIVPSVVKCFSRIQLNIDRYPEGFDYKKKYKAKVTNQRDYFTFDVQLIKPID